MLPPILHALLVYIVALYGDIDGKKHERMRRRSINAILHVRVPPRR
jgi:hypothetical protein